MSATKEKLTAEQKARVHKNAELYRKHGWRLVNVAPGPHSDVQPSAIEFWVKDGRVSLVQVWLNDGGVSNYFQGGGHTWEELEAVLTRPDPGADARLLAAAPKMRAACKAALAADAFNDQNYRKLCREALELAGVQS